MNKIQNNQSWVVNVHFMVCIPWIDSKQQKVVERKMELMKKVFS